MKGANIWRRRRVSLLQVKERLGAHAPRPFSTQDLQYPELMGITDANRTQTQDHRVSGQVRGKSYAGIADVGIVE
jgi:hypothetical protein